MKQSVPMTLLLLIVSGLLYSIISFAYMHETFVTHDISELMFEQLNRIERKIDALYVPRGGQNGN